MAIDCNRPAHALDLIPTVSDGTRIPGNLDLSAAAREVRLAAIHRPFHAAIAAILDAGRAKALVALHSFTPRLAGGPDRPWDAGFCCNRDGRLATALLAEMGRLAPAACLALNQPYGVDDEGDYTIPVHGEARGLPHVLVELRHDGIAEEAGQQRWADLLAAALARSRIEEMAA
jgi:predicted N-formylglutamate amidohydrolase